MSETTEQLILRAAHDTFLANGFDGTSMQMIADSAGINKALLHYYFRSKDKLFHAVFIDIFGKFVPPLLGIMTSDKPFFERLESFIELYIDNINKNPLVPLFILHELKRDPDHLIQIIHSSGIHPELIISLMKKEIEQGTIIEMDPRHLFINILSLCIFPFAAKPLMKGLFYNDSDKEYSIFIESRKKEVSRFIINAIRKP